MSPAVEENVIELTVYLPVELHEEIVAYCAQWGASPSWALRRAARFMLDGEQEQTLRMAIARQRRQK